ncbi:succinate-semialdehyde dehydrogenase / glutarate-semialdehyde dehydrogenase [Rhizobiales bacterium GAS113]|nr:succinate-semialdehyde dehydrogenase / glutarate-semialdehyde dehydrogenase [Rhizobiales bacterium GAS113]
MTDVACGADYAAPSLFIDGAWLGPQGRATHEIVNPANGATIGVLPLASRADLDMALEAARKGFQAWRKVSPYERSKVLRHAAALLREREAAIGRAMTLEQGKLVSEARSEAIAAADIFEWFAEEGRRAYGRVVPSREPGLRNLVLREPIGPVAAFSPWNFPITIPARKIAAALAAGCSCIIKPAEETPSSCLAIARALDDAGLPKGVLNVVFGVPSEVSTHLIASTVIRKISFTGSTKVGKTLAKLAAEGVKPATLELGGHAPVIAFADADIDRAAATMARSKFRNAGQICVAPTRFYLHESVHDRFVERFSGLARGLKLGDGLDAATGMGPLANARRLDAMERLIGDAQACGARLETGGRRASDGGYFWQPTVLSDVPNSARIMNEEPFGPVAVTQRFREFDAVIEEANRLPFGLAAFAFTASAKTATAVSDALEAGMIGVNHAVLTSPETPFGGVKESGYGSEGGSEALDQFLVTKYVAQG